ncbi:MAG TPA: hypothetical protein VN643_13100 [Pyrinomonadaceae bacterium]|nr:hypothetical protein [Pyrinomonadaceae bacterium]
MRNGLQVNGFDEPIRLSASQLARDHRIGSVTLFADVQDLYFSGQKSEVFQAGLDSNLILA